MFDRFMFFFFFIVFLISVFLIFSFFILHVFFLFSSFFFFFFNRPSRRQNWKNSGNVPIVKMTIFLFVKIRFFGPRWTRRGQECSI